MWKKQVSHDMTYFLHYINLTTPMTIAADDKYVTFFLILVKITIGMSYESSAVR